MKTKFVNVARKYENYTSNVCNAGKPRLFHYMVSISGTDVETVKIQIFRNKKHCDICNSSAHPHPETKKHVNNMAC